MVAVCVCSLRPESDAIEPRWLTYWGGASGRFSKQAFLETTLSTHALLLFARKLGTVFDPNTFHSLPLFFQFLSKKMDNGNRFCKLICIWTDLGSENKFARWWMVWDSEVGACWLKVPTGALHAPSQAIRVDFRTVLEQFSQLSPLFGRNYLR